MDGTGKILLDAIIAKLQRAKYEQLQVIYIFVRRIIK